MNFSDYERGLSDDENCIKKRKSHRQTKEEAIYGIFAEVSNDEKYYKRDRKKPFDIFSKPVRFESKNYLHDDDETTINEQAGAEPAFVKSRTPVESDDDGEKLSRPSDRQSRWDGEDDDEKIAGEDDSGTVGDDQSRDAKKERRRRKKSVEPADFDKDFGQFSKHTRGFGMKILQKFGFTGRLGKEETGRVNPIIPKARLTKKGKMSRAGLNFMGIDKKEEDGKRTEERKKERIRERLNKLSWRKNKKKEKLKTAKDVLENKERIKQRESFVFDFTKDEKGQRVELRGAAFESGGDSVLFPELRYNLGRTVESIELKILRNDSEKQRVAKERMELNERLSKIDFNVKVAAEKVERFEAFSSFVEQIEESFGGLQRLQDEYSIQSEKTDKSEEMRTKILKILEKGEVLKNKFRFEFDSFSLANVLSSSLINPLRALLVTWNPLLVLSSKFGRKKFKKNDSATLSIFKKLRYLLYDSFSSQKPSESLFDDICGRIIAPKFRDFIVNDWDALRKNSELVSLFKQYSAELPDQLFQTLFTSFVSVKLMALVNAWELKRTDLSLDYYITPWADFLGDKAVDSMSCVFDFLFKKLSMFLEAWTVLDDSALLVLLKYRNVLPEKVAALIKTKVVPKLAVMVKETDLSPIAQNFTVFVFIKKWEEIFSYADLLYIFEKNFFPRWITIIHIWVTNPNTQKSTLYKDITKWYMTWKLYLPTKLYSNPLFLENILLALDLFNCCVRDYKIPPLQIVLDSLASRLASLRAQIADGSADPIKNNPSNAFGMLDGDFNGTGRSSKTPEKSPAFPNSNAAHAKQHPGYSSTEGDRANSRAGKLPPKSGFSASENPLKDINYSFKDIVGAFAEDNNVEFYPNPNAYFNGKQVFNFGRHSIYLDNMCAYVKRAESWLPVSLKDLLCIAWGGVC